MSQSTQELAKHSSVSSKTRKRHLYITNQRYRALPAITHDFLTKSTLTYFSMPLLINSMYDFFQTIETMEDEIMFPSRLKDMPIKELFLENTIQPDNWHEIYRFTRDIRDQLRCRYPFAANDNNDDLRTRHKEDPTDDEGIMILNDDHNQYLSTSSTVSSGEFEQSLSLISSTGTSLKAIKNELKYHYYSLFRSLETLTSMTQRVTEKYRAESIF